MPDKKLTDNEIIKEFQLCTLKAEHPGFILCGQIVGLINHQKAEVSELQHRNSELEIELKSMRGAANSYKAEVERLLTEFTRLKGEIAQPYILINADAEATSKMIEALKTQKALIVPGNEATVEFIDKASIKAEAYKEFAERLKDKHRRITDYDEAGFGAQIFIFEERVIDNLLKEMVGDKE